jgi:hypothetical protein
MRLFALVSWFMNGRSICGSGSTQRRPCRYGACTGRCRGSPCRNSGGRTETAPPVARPAEPMTVVRPTVVQRAAAADKVPPRERPSAKRGIHRLRPRPSARRVSSAPLFWIERIASLASATANGSNISVISSGLVWGGSSLAARIAPGNAAIPPLGVRPATHPLAPSLLLFARTRPAPTHPGVCRRNAAQRGFHQAGDDAAERADARRARPSVHASGGIVTT